MFDKIKRQLHKSPVLYIPDNKGTFNLYSNTSKFATHSALYQIQNGQPKLIGYASKRMPTTAKNYSITEVELCALLLTLLCMIIGLH